MKKLTGTSLALTLAMSFGATSAMASSFEDKDMAFAFGSGDAMEVTMLSDHEMQKTEGKFWWTVAFGAVGGIVNSGAYIANNWNNNFSAAQAAYSFGTGFTGGFVAALPGSNAARLGYAAVGGTLSQVPMGGW